MKKGTVIYNLNEQKSSVNILLYGIISDWSDASGNNVANQLAQFEGKYQYLNVYVNSNGGSVTEGIAIFNILRRANFEVSIYVDGVAASMAAVILQVPGAKRYMAKYTRIMMHRISGMTSGSADKMREAADMMDSFEDELIDIVGERTGLGESEIKAKWFNGKDNWLTPQQALDEKLIDGIVDGKVTREPAGVNNVVEAIDFYDLQITNFLNQNNDTMDLTQFVNALGMSADATETQVLAQIQKVTGQVATLKNQVETLTNEKKVLEDAAKAVQAAQVKAMIDNAIAAKKITEEQRPTFEALAAVDFENASKALDAIPAPTNLRNFTGDGNDGPIPENRKDWTFQDWQKKDGHGLQALKNDHTEAYKALYDKAFPKG